MLVPEQTRQVFTIINIKNSNKSKQAGAELSFNYSSQFREAAKNIQSGGVPQS